VTLNHGALAIAQFSLSKLAGKTNIVTSVALLPAKLNLAVSPRPPLMSVLTRP
jgi:hypothetical protein